MIHLGRVIGIYRAPTRLSFLSAIEYRVIKSLLFMLNYDPLFLRVGVCAESNQALFSWAHQYD